MPMALGRAHYIESLVHDDGANVFDSLAPLHMGVARLLLELQVASQTQLV